MCFPGSRSRQNSETFAALNQKAISNRKPGWMGVQIDEDVPILQREVFELRQKERPRVVDPGLIGESKSPPGLTSRQILPDDSGVRTS